MSIQRSRWLRSIYAINETTNYEEVIASKGDNLKINIGILILSLIGAILSLAAILIIAHNRKLRKRTSNKFLLSLFSADFGVTLLMVIFHALMISHDDDDERIKGVAEAKNFHILISDLTLLSIMNRITVTLDRAVAVKKPFYYENKCNGKMVIWITVVQHILAIIYLGALYGTEQAMTEDMDVYYNLMRLLFICIISIGFIILTVSSIIVYIEAKRQILMISKHTYHSKENQHTLRQKECKIVRINLGMVLVFVLCWTPFLVSILQEHNGEDMEITMTVSLYLVALNYVLDPIIYVSLSRDVKQQIKRMFNFHKHAPTVKTISNNSAISTTTTDSKL